VWKILFLGRGSVLTRWDGAGQGHPRP